MNLARLDEIVNACTRQFRKGEMVEVRNAGRVQVTEIWGMPHVSEFPPELEQRDVVFFVVGVDRKLAETYRDEIRTILREYPEPTRLAGGPSFIEFAGILPWDQEQAMRLYALGDVIGLWKLLTPYSVGFTGDEARDLAGRGFVYLSGYKP